MRCTVARGSHAQSTRDSTTHSVAEQSVLRHYTGVIGDLSAYSQLIAQFKFLAKIIFRGLLCLGGLECYMWPI